MWIIKNRIVFYIISVGLIAISAIAMISPGMKFGIDFEGGSLLQVSFNERPEQIDFTEQVAGIAEKQGIETAVVQPSGELAYTIRSVSFTEEQKQQFVDAIISSYASSSPKVDRFTAIGPTVGNELRQKAFLAIGLVVLAILLFITYAFRGVSKPVVSWKYGVATLVALAHDIIIPTGMYIIYTYYFGGDIDMLFVSALLAVLGFSVHDTIVVFDRVRENLRLNMEQKNKEDFELTVGRSVAQTFTRSINTSLTTAIVLVAMLVFGSSAITNFTLVLLLGIIVGTYSSIFIASPLLVTLYKMQKSE